MGNNCDYYQPHPVPELQGEARDSSPKALPEFTREVYPDHQMDNYNSDVDLGNFTLEGCLRITLDMNKLCLALDVHAYLFGTLFLILVVIACIVLMTLLRNQPGSKSFIVTINILVIIFGLLRTLYLFIDAYALKGRFQGIGALLFADLAFPCLTSAFALVQWVFLELLRMKRVSRALQNSRVLVSIIVCHFVFVATIDFILFYVGKEACVLITICQVVNVLWGLILTFGFLYTTQKLLKRDKEHRLTLKRSQYGFSGQRNTVNSKSSRKDPSNSMGKLNDSIKKGENITTAGASGQYSPRIQRGVAGKQNGVDTSLTEISSSETNSKKIDGNEIEIKDQIITRPLRRLRRTLKSSFSKSIIRKSYLTKVKNAGIATALVGLGLFSVSLYGLIAVYNPFSDGLLLGGDWGWYIFQTLHRILELCFGCIMVYLSVSRKRQ